MADLPNSQPRIRKINMKNPSKNLILLAACAVALVTSGCANSDRGATATQDISLNRSETGVGDGGAGNAGPGGAGSIGGAGGHGGGGH